MCYKIYEHYCTRGAIICITFDNKQQSEKLRVTQSEKRLRQMVKFRKCKSVFSTTGDALSLVINNI